MNKLKNFDQFQSNSNKIGGFDNLLNEKGLSKMSYSTHTAQEYQDRLIQYCFIIGFWDWLKDHHPDWTRQAGKWMQNVLAHKSKIIDFISQNKLPSESSVRISNVLTGILPPFLLKGSAPPTLMVSIHLSPFPFTIGPFDAREFSIQRSINRYVADPYTSKPTTFVAKLGNYNEYSKANNPFSLLALQHFFFLPDNFDQFAESAKESEFKYDLWKNFDTSNKITIEKLKKEFSPSKKYSFDESHYKELFEFIEEIMLKRFEESFKDRILSSKDWLKERGLKLLKVALKKNETFTTKALETTNALNPAVLNELSKNFPDLYNKIKNMRPPEEQWKTDLSADLGDIGF